MSGSDPWHAVDEMAACQYGVFTRSQASQCEVSAKRLRTALGRGRIRLVTPQVFAMASAPSTIWQLLMTGSLLGGAASHRSAAALHGFDGFALHRAEVSFERRRERAMPRGVVVHTWRYESSNDITVVNGVRCTSIARTLVQLGAVCDRALVESALDSALRDGASKQWIAQTLERLSRPGVTGAAVLRSITDDVGRADQVESVLERRLERALRTTGLPGLVTQHEIVTSDGAYRVDIAYPEAKIAIEGHSHRHHSGHLAATANSGRHLALSAQGWLVVYVTWQMLNDPADFLPSLIATHRQRVASRAA